MKIERTTAYRWPEIEQALFDNGYDKNFLALWVHWVDNQDDEEISLLVVDNDRIQGVCHAIVLDQDTMWMDEICYFEPDDQEEVFTVFTDYLAEELRKRDMTRLLTFLELPYIMFFDKVGANGGSIPEGRHMRGHEIAESAGLSQLLCYANPDQDVDVGDYYLMHHGGATRYLKAIMASLYPFLVEPEGLNIFAFTHAMHALTLFIDQLRTGGREREARLHQDGTVFPYLVFSTLENTEDSAEWLPSIEALKARIAAANMAYEFAPYDIAVLQSVLQDTKYAMNQYFELWGASLSEKFLSDGDEKNRIPVQ
jgi:hypothetical protein